MVAPHAGSHAELLLTVACSDPPTGDAVRKLAAFVGSDEGLMAFSVKNVSLHDWIRVRLDGELLLTTPGRVIINQTLPIGRAARESDHPDVVLEPLTFQNTALDKKGLRMLVVRLFTLYGGEVTATVVSDIKRIAYHYANQAGFTLGHGRAAPGRQGLHPGDHSAGGQQGRADSPPRRRNRGLVLPQGGRALEPAPRRRSGTPA